MCVTQYTESRDLSLGLIPSLELSALIATGISLPTMTCGRLIWTDLASPIVLPWHSTLVVVALRRIVATTTTPIMLVTTTVVVMMRTTIEVLTVGWVVIAAALVIVITSASESASVATLIQVTLARILFPPGLPTLKNLRLFALF